MPDERLPTLYENARIRVFKNPSDEIFIEIKGEYPIQIRVSDMRDHLVVTAGNGKGILTPWMLNGLPAFKASRGVSGLSESQIRTRG